MYVEHLLINQGAKMTSLGGWSPYVNLAEISEWYTLPSTTAEQLAMYRPDGNELNPMPDFDEINLAICRHTDSSVNPKHAPGHGSAHAKYVTRKGMDAYHLNLRLTGQRLPVVVGQSLELALYTHDAHHDGCTFRCDAKARGTLTLPEFGTNSSVEWVTAYMINEWLERRGVILPARLFITKIHWASTFGGQSDLGRKLHIPTPEPHDLYGCIMRAADVCPLGSIEEVLSRAIAINYGEIPAFAPARTWREFVQGEIEFLRGYVTHCFNRLDRVADVPLTHELKWRALLESHVHELTQLQLGNRPDLAAFIWQELARYGVALNSAA